MPIGYTRGMGGGAPLPPAPYDTYPKYMEDWPPIPPEEAPPPPYDVAPNYDYAYRPPPPRYNPAPTYDYAYDRVAPEGYVLNDDGTISPEPGPESFPPAMSMEPGPPPPDLILGGSAWPEPPPPQAGQYASNADQLGFEPFSMDTYASAPLGNNAYLRSYYDALRQQAVAQALAQSRR